MSRYQPRNSFLQRGTTPTAGPAFGFAKQLAMQRHGNRPIPKKITPVKPVLSSTKQKEGEIKKILDKNFIPSGLRLAKMRQLAAQHKILGEKARDFLHRSEAGHRLDNSDSIIKYEAELVEAAAEATAGQAGHSPIKFKFRGEDHLREKGKMLYRKLQQESAEQAHKEQQQLNQANALADRRERLAAMHAAINPAAAQAPAQTPTASTRATMPLLAVTQLPRTEGAAGNPGTLYATRSGTPGDAPHHPLGQADVASLGVPGVAGHEHMGTPTITPPDSASPATAPANPPPSTEVTLPSTDHLGDAFG